MLGLVARRYGGVRLVGPFSASDFNVTGAGRSNRCSSLRVDSRQILPRLPEPLYRPVDPLADRPPVEILLPAESLKRDALDQVVLE